MQRSAFTDPEVGQRTSPNPIYMQMTYFIWKLPNWYSYVLDWYANYLIDIHTALIDVQIT